MKKIGKIFSVLLVALLLTGCVKEEIHMDIKSNGDVTVSAIVAFASSMAGDDGMSVSEENKKEFESQGWKVEDYKEDDLVGVKLTKTYKIDSASSDKEHVVDLAQWLNDGKETIFFQKLDENKYKAKMFIDASTTGVDSEQAAAYASSIKISYSVTLPSKAISHNADKVDGNTLTWNAKIGEVKNIEYEFSLNGSSSTMWIIIGIIVVAAAAIVVVVLLMTKKNKQNPNGTAVGYEMPVMPVNNGVTPVAQPTPEIPTGVSQGQPVQSTGNTENTNNVM